MDKKFENLSSKDKWLVGLLAAGVITGLGYLFYKNSNNKTLPNNEEIIPQFPQGDDLTSKYLFEKSEEY